MAAVAVGVLFATVFGIFLLWRAGEWALDRLVYENKAFAIEAIEVQTDGVIAPEHLRRWTGVQPGRNLLALDLARVKRDLEMVSVIKSASVERILPHTLRVRVIEREPVAQINLPRPRAGGGVETALFHVDADGQVMLPLDPSQRAAPPSQPEALPAICGVHGNDVQPGRSLNSPQARAALRLVVAFERSPMAGLVDLKRVDISDPEVMVATTADGSEVTFGLTDPEQQLRRWRGIFDMSQKMSKAIATLDLAITNNIPARWQEASAAPPETQKPTKPLKKKHV
jgi:cell division septal protein FtsQ